MNDHPPLFGVPPGVRALLSGTPPYGNSLRRDLYASIAYHYPAVISGDRSWLLAQVGGEPVIAELITAGWKATTAAMDAGCTVESERLLVTRMFHVWDTLDRLLNSRHAVEIELDLDLGGDDPLDALWERLTILLAMAGEARAREVLQGVLWKHARSSETERREAIYAAAIGASLLRGEIWGRCRPGGGLIDVIGQWRDHGRKALAHLPGQPVSAASPDVPTPTSLKRLPKAAAEAAPAAPPGSVVVFPGLAKAAAGKPDNERDIKAALGDALGAALPGVPVPADWDAWEAPILARWPHLPEVPRAIREAQAGRTHWGAMRLCLVGPAGIGKTAIGRYIAEHSGLPFGRYNADNSTDNSFGGTSVRWTTGHLGAVPAMLAEHRRATGLMQIDELEKASGHRSSNGGKLHDVLHGQWDSETSSRWLCPFSAMPLDLSHVAYLATANSLDGVAPSLRDRLRVLEVRAPGPEHLAALVPQVAAQACREQGLDPAWGGLDSTEWSVRREAWGAGGSIRRLQHLFATLFRARDADPSLPRH